MWIPSTEVELREAIESGAVTETATLEFKSELPPSKKNGDLARDVCAMTVDGGTIVYGVAEKEGQALALTPVEFDGVRERIDQIVRASISEEPAYTVHFIPTDADPARGYVVVEIPASPRAPHMVIRSGDFKFWKRGDATNAPMTEAEVSALYGRRHQEEIDLFAAVSESSLNWPFNALSDDMVGKLTMLALPFPSKKELMVPAMVNPATKQETERGIRDSAESSDPFFHLHPQPMFDRISADGTLGARAWVMSDRNSGTNFSSRISIGRDGRIEAWQQPAGAARNGKPQVYEPLVAKAVCQFLAVAQYLYERAGFRGALGLGLSISGIRDAYPGSWTNIMTLPSTFGEDAYTQVLKVSHAELREGFRNTVQGLISPFVSMFSQPNYDVFENTVFARGQ